MIQLNDLKLIARGGQADIYELDQDKIIRVLRNKDEEDSLKTEMAIMKSLKEKGKAVPKVYEFLKIEGRPSIIMERLFGDSMLNKMQKKPFEFLKQAQNLAKLHMDVADSADGLGMISINDRAAYLIPKAEMLDSDLRGFVLDNLAELPKGKDICHGDFHPGNIMIGDNKAYFLDWMTACKGDPCADVARTGKLSRLA
jgi:aminoglycoside phosphotransferase (APT) family kinase protein